MNEEAVLYSDMKIGAVLGIEIYILGTLCLLLFFGMAAIVFRRYLGKGVYEIYTQKLMECLQPHDRLPSLVFPDIEYIFNRRLLLSILADLAVMLEGVEGRILTLIFHDNGLYRHILKECRAGNDYRKIMAMSIFQNIPIPQDMMDELRRFIDSSNDELRMISLLVWLNQAPEEMMERLSRYPHELSDRDCANIFSLGQRRGLKLEEIEKLRDSPNPSVQRFRRRVLKWKGFTV